MRSFYYNSQKILFTSAQTAQTLKQIYNENTRVVSKNSKAVRHVRHGKINLLNMTNLTNRTNMTNLTMLCLTSNCDKYFFTSVFQNSSVNLIVHNKTPDAAKVAMRFNLFNQFFKLYLYARVLQFVDSKYFTSQQNGKFD